MQNVMNTFKQFRDDEDGAAMVEYSILIGIITVASIASILLVGTYVSGRWSALTTALALTGA